MRRAILLSAIFFLFFVIPFLKSVTAQASNLIVGVNVVDCRQYGPQHEAALFDELQKNGVKVIRVELGSHGATCTDFIINAYQRGISSELILWPRTLPGSIDDQRHGPSPLSQTDPEEFVKWFTPELAKLEAAGVRITAFEVGNEINTGRFNGDFASPGSGRVLGLNDLNNPNDKEAQQVATGYKTYLKTLAALKNIRDHAQVNKSTPIITAGLANEDLPGPKSFDKKLGSSIPDTIEFFRQNGADNYVDGYGTHVYPSGDTHQPVSARVAYLDKEIMAACLPKKPCWMTEWGFSNSRKTCPLDESNRLQVIEAERNAFKPFIEQGRLAAILFYSWSGVFGANEEEGAIFRCGALTDAGKAALNP